MAETQSSETPAPHESAADGKAQRQAARLAKQITAFAQRHGGSAEGQLAYLGQRGVRIVLVGADGGWGDLVATSHAVAEQAVERAGITVRETFDGEMAAKVRTGPYEWSRMAGMQIGGPANP
ncbi:hypothetical protein [Streptomyces sp. GSL17-111]|uniref:hypothetical protein n=1 Tax=Streptomyces sp. GSL17-111 TaxID=3121596 RepID=UPI0030F3E62E